MSGPVRVSVVLPTYNRLRTLPRAVRSVLDQDFDSLELIVVDDASTDGTAEWLGRLARGDARVRVVRHERNRGVSAARNSGIAAASGEYIAFQDSDDEWLPGRLRLLIGCFDGLPADVGVVAGGLLRLERGGREVPCYWKTPRADAPWQLVSYEDIASAVFAHCQAMVVRRRILDDLGGFDAAFAAGEDWDFCLRAVTRCRIAEVPAAVTRAYASADSLTRRRDQLAHSFEAVLQRDAARMSEELQLRVMRMIALDACAAGDLGRAQRYLGLASGIRPDDRRLATLNLLMRYVPNLVRVVLRVLRSGRYAWRWGW